MPGRPRLLKDEDVVDIRRMYWDRSAKWSATSLARLFRCSETTINNVIERRGAYKDQKNGTLEDND